TIRTRRPRTYHLELPGAASRAVLWHCMPPRLARAALGVASARLIAQIASRRDTPLNRASFASSNLSAQSDANALATRTSCLHAAAPHNRSARDMVAMPIVEIINGPSVTKTSVSTGWTMDMPVVRVRPLTPANAAWKPSPAPAITRTIAEQGGFNLPCLLADHRSLTIGARVSALGARVSALRGTCVRAREPTWLGAPRPAGPRRLGLHRYGRPPMGPGGPHASARLREGSAISRPGPASA